MSVRNSDSPIGILITFRAPSNVKRYMYTVSEILTPLSKVFTKFYLKGYLYGCQKF